MSVLLLGGWVFAGLFEFDEGGVSSGEDDESVGHASVAWAGDFYAESSVLLGCLCELFFDGFF